MILGIGHDLVDMQRLAKLLERFGPRFIARTFTEAEQAYAATKADPLPTFAKRFAAKEACAKALGTGLGAGARFREIGVIRSEKGAPLLKLTGNAAKTLAARLPSGYEARLHLSLSDDWPIASAFVIIEGIVKE